jgi:hypothetical protein
VISITPSYTSLILYATLVQTLVMSVPVQGPRRTFVNLRSACTGLLMLIDRTKVTNCVWIQDMTYLAVITR